MNAELQETELEQQALTWPQKARAIAIIDQSSYDEAACLLLAVADLKKQVIDHHREPKQKADEAHKAICAAEKRLLDPLKEAESIIKLAIGVWDREQERIRLEAQRKADEEARQREEAARLALAVEAEKQGSSEETVKEILETPLPLQRPVVASTFQKAAGIAASHKPAWKWRVVDEKLIPRDYLSVNEIKINAVVRALGNAAKIPGIQIYEDVPNISVRGRR